MGLNINPYGDNGDSFLYDCDEVKFDEPRKLIKGLSSNNWTICAQNDTIDEVDG